MLNDSLSYGSVSRIRNRRRRFGRLDESWRRTLTDQGPWNGIAERAFRIGRHAKNRLRLYRGTPDEVTIDQVLDIVERPDLVTPSIKGRSNAWRFRDPKWVRITHTERGTATEIVTVTVHPLEKRCATMKLTYDPEVDALYIQLRAAAAADSVDYEEGVTADLDVDGHVIGIEILDASERLDPAAVATLARAQRAASAA